MEALSALRMFNPAALRESPLGKAGTEALQKAGLGDLGKLIPDSEMGKLQPFNKEIQVNDWADLDDESFIKYFKH